jgi:hypothetical protein
MSDPNEGFHPPGLPLKFDTWRKIDNQSLLSAPVASSWGLERIDLFACNDDHEVLHNYWSGGWHGWENLRGYVDGAEAMTATSWGVGRIDCFVRGKEEGFWHKAWWGKWEPWQDLNDLIKGPHKHVRVEGLSALAQAEHHLSVFVVERDPEETIGNSFVSNFEWEAGSWYLESPIVPVDRLISIIGSPSAVYLGDGHVQLFARRRQDNHIWTASWRGEMKHGRRAWRGWFDIENGASNSSPAAVLRHPGQIDLFIRGIDDGLWHNWWNGVQWRGWESLGGVLTTAPSVVSLSPTSVDVFVRGKDDLCVWTIHGQVGVISKPKEPIK